MAFYRLNEQKNGVEIVFNAKPEAETLEALKMGGFRWHRGGGYWYAKETAATIALAEMVTNGNAGAAKKDTEKKASQNAGTPQDHIKIYWNGMKVDGGELIKCGYSINKNGGSVCIYVHDYKSLPRNLFEVRNDTDIYTDYFDNDSATVDQSHPLYKYIVYAAHKATIHQAKTSIKYYQRQIAKYEGRNGWGRYVEDYKKSIERLQNEITNAENAAGSDPGQPTAEDLEQINRARQEAENARREAEKAAELAERERVLNERCDGRRYIESIAEKYPIAEGAPVVEIEWSENPAFYSWTESQDRTKTEIVINEDGTTETKTEIIEPRRRCLLSVTAADIVLKHYDEIEHAKHAGYDKTGFKITWTDESGEPSTYEGRYDLGDNDGGLINHIELFARWELTHDKYGHEKETPETSNPRLTFAEYLKQFLAA